MTHPNASSPQRITDKLVDEWLGKKYKTEEVKLGVLRLRIEAALKKAVEEEREQIAKMIENSIILRTPSEIAALIRERGQK